MKFRWLLIKKHTHIHTQNNVINPSFTFSVSNNIYHLTKISQYSKCIALVFYERLNKNKIYFNMHLY